MKAEALKARVRELSEPIAESLGLFVYDLDITRTNRLIIRLSAERRSKTETSEGITVAECARLSRQLEKLLDLEEVIPSHYALEVSSPGLERRLKSPEHFVGAIGEKISVLTTSPEASDGVVEGMLVSVEEDHVVVEEKGRQVALTFLEIRRARTVYRG